MAAPPSKSADSVDVLLPCSSLLARLEDLDGDGQLDCTMTQEQNGLAEYVPPLQGTWHISSRHTISEGRVISSPLKVSSITIGAGTLCVPPMAKWSAFLDQAVTEQLPTIFTNVNGFDQDGKKCEASGTCEPIMWSFELSYPVSMCTPGVAGWVQPCSAKVLVDGTVALVRGPRSTLGKFVKRPPLMPDVNEIGEVMAFANGLAAADLQVEVLLLEKSRSRELNAGM